MWERSPSPRFPERAVFSRCNDENPSIQNKNQRRADPNLHFVEMPALAPPEVQIDMATQAKIEVSCGRDDEEVNGKRNGGALSDAARAGP